MDLLDFLLLIFIILVFVVGVGYYLFVVSKSKDR